MRTRILPSFVLLAAACTSGGGSIAVTATDSFCQLNEVSLRAGKHTFAIKNEGSGATDVAVFTSSDRLITKTPRIGPGKSAKLSVQLGAGQYQVACRPGGTGDGNRSTIYVASKTGQDPGIRPPDGDRVVSFTARDFRFEGLGQLNTAEGQVSGGEVLIFTMTNKGPGEHEFRVTAADGKALGTIARLAPGKVGSVTVVPERGGVVTYFCGIANHAQRGMKGTFSVVA